MTFLKFFFSTRTIKSNEHNRVPVASVFRRRRETSTRGPYFEHVGRLARIEKLDNDVGFSGTLLIKFEITFLNGPSDTGG